MRVRIVIAGMGLLCLLTGRWAKADLYNDGGVYDILSGSYDRIDVDNPAPPGPAYTTVNLGGTATVNRTETYNNSQLTIDEGVNINQGFSAHDKSRVTVNGGTVWGIGGPSYAYDKSQLTINGGRFIASDLSAYDNSQLTINDGYFHMGMSVQTYGNSQTTMNGGRVQGNFLAHDNSQVTTTWGSSIHESLYAYNHTKLDINGYVKDIDAYDNTQVTFNGATRWLNAYDNTRVTINGGGILNDAKASDNARVTMNGGNVSELDGIDNSRVTVNGGEISGFLVATGNSRVIVSGGYLEGQLVAWAGGEMTLIGSDFVVYTDRDRTDLVFSGFGDLDSSFDTCWLFGTLATGSRPLTYLQLRIYDESEISLVAAPLPGAALLGTIGLLYSGWRLRRQTR